MSTYSILIKILDKIGEDAPIEYLSYKPNRSDVDKLNQARARAFIHLFLMANVGIIDFEVREHYITDGPRDGGIDGYYINDKTKVVYFIQSKFRITEESFHKKNIEIEELLKMDIRRILDGHTTHENEDPYNSKIIDMQSRIRKTSDIGLYSYEVIILANLHRSITIEKLKALTGGLNSTIFDYKKTYSDLVFPVITGTYYSYSNLNININLANKSNAAKTKYTVETEYGRCEIILLFAPLYEIGKLMYEYKNSILRYNPRSYLSLKKDSINDEVRKTIVEKSTNEFALFNNGITIFSDEARLNETIGEKDLGKLSLINPQIINGGQTAYTLSIIYENSLKVNNSLRQRLEEKEVLIKIIKFSIPSDATSDKRIALIESISDASNKQSQVNSADRSSNNPKLIESQRDLFNDFGFLLERKRGEFFDGLRYGYIDKENVINRGVFMRIAFACLQIAPPTKKENKLLTPARIDLILNDKSNFKKYFFGCMCYTNILIYFKNESIESRKGEIYAIIKVAVNTFYDETMPNENLKELSESAVRQTLSTWKEFEEYVSEQFHNSDYFKHSFSFATNTIKSENNYNKYYSSSYLPIDLNDFFVDMRTKAFEDEGVRRKLKTVEKYMSQNYLNPQLIKKVKPLINPSRWFDEESMNIISKSLLIDPRTVGQAIKAITSKDIGYYFRKFYN